MNSALLVSLFMYLAYLFKNFGAYTRYKVKSDKIVSNSTAITGHKNGANVTPQHKHTKKHRMN